MAPLGDTKPAELLKVAACAEQYSNHPVAKALVQLAAEAGVPLEEAPGFTEIAGRGIQARFKGSDVVIGRAQWLADRGVGNGFLQTVDLDEADGWSLIFVARDLRRLPFLIRFSRETGRVINQNFLIGLSFVVGGMVLSILNYISPVVAAGFHVIGSLLVVFNSFRLVRQGEEFAPHQSASAPAS